MEFTADNDFEGGRWIGEEFVYEKEKKRKVQSKKSARYGVFDEDGSSGSDYDSSGGDTDDDDVVLGRCPGHHYVATI